METSEGRETGFWSPIEQFEKPLTVASRLDPVARLPRDVSLYLRQLVLLWGRVLIPETHLLNNRQLACRLDNPAFRADFEEFIQVAQPIISRNDHHWNDSFEIHWEKSTNSGNPLLVPGPRGLGYARYLDTIVSRDQCRSYRVVERARSFPDLFSEALHSTFVQDVLRTEALPLLIEFFREPSLTADRAKEREETDKFNGLSRGRVVEALHALSRDPHLRIFRPQVEEASRQAYVRNVLASLNRDVHNAAVVPLLSESQLTADQAYRFHLDEELAEETIRSLGGHGRLYALDRHTLSRMSWEQVVSLARSPFRRAFHEARNELAFAPSKSETLIREMVKNLDRYLIEVGDTVRGRKELRVSWRRHFGPRRILGELATTVLLSITFPDLAPGTVAAVAFHCAASAGKEVRAVRRKTNRRRRLRDYLLSGSSGSSL